MQPKIKPHAPDSPLDHDASRLENSDDGQYDTNLSRLSAGVIGVGTGSQGSTAGGLIAASSTVVGNFTTTGNILGNGTLALTGTTGTTTIASGQGFTIGGSQFVVQQ